MNDADLLGRALRTFDPKNAPQGARRKLRRIQERQRIEEMPRLDVTPDESVKGFAPFSVEELRDKRVIRTLRVWAKRGRNPERVAFARKALKQIDEQRVSK